MPSLSSVQKKPAARPDRNVGSRDCWRTAQLSGPCSRCKRRTEHVADGRAHIHIQERAIYCGDCCPLCRIKGEQ